MISISWLQPLGVSFNKPFRELVREMQDELLRHENDTENFIDWTASKRRVFILTGKQAAWPDLYGDLER
jgi:hypothetical protein